MQFIGTSDLHVTISGIENELSVMMSPEDSSQFEKYILDNDIPDEEIKQCLSDWLPKHGYEPHENAPFVKWSDLIPPGRTVDQKLFFERYRARIISERKITSPAHFRSLKQEVVNEILAEQQG